MPMMTWASSRRPSTRRRITNPNFAMNQGNADEQKPILVIFHGHIRFASNGVQWRAEYDGKRVRARSTQLAPDHWITGFDGSRYYDWQVGQHRVTLYETHHSPKQWTARNLFWNESDVLIDLLEKPARAGIPRRDQDRDRRRQGVLCRRGGQGRRRRADALRHFAEPGLPADPSKPANRREDLPGLRPARPPRGGAGDLGSGTNRVRLAERPQ